MEGDDASSNGPNVSGSGARSISDSQKKLGAADKVGATHIFTKLSQNADKANPVGAALRLSLLPPRTVPVHLSPGRNMPDEVVDDFVAALRAGDADTATTLFSRQGCFVTPDSTVIEGREQIREVIQQLVDMERELRIEQRTMLTAGDVAVAFESWSLRIGNGSTTVHRTSRATIVLGRVEGVWRIAVADPWRG